MKPASDAQPDFGSNVRSWIRAVDPMQSDNTEPWHLMATPTSSGIRMAQCGDLFLPRDAIEQREFADPPDVLGMCDTCLMGGSQGSSRRATERSGQPARMR